MTKKQHTKRLTLSSQRMIGRLERELKGVIRFIDELSPYVKANPEDNWAAKMLGHYQRRRKQLRSAIKRIEEQPESDS